MNATATLDQAPSQTPILNISAYKFVHLEHVLQRREQLLQLCRRLELRGTILLSSEGINLFLAGQPAAIQEFLRYLRSDPALADLQTKDSYSATQPFRRMLVRLKKEIIAFGVDGVAPEEHTSPKISPRQLQQWLDEGRPLRLLDTRNIYEYELGTFDAAEHLHIDHFREFPQAIAQLPEEAKRQPLVMFCTGGIRCEKAGPMMEQAGFEQVYQLDGGILKYFEECGGKHYHGSCFVFDGRVALDPELKPTGNVLCFACQAVLSPAEVNSAHYVVGQSCPRCYSEANQRTITQLQQREAAIRQAAASQPGCAPYENVRKIYVPRRYAGWSLIDFLDAWHPPTTREQWLAWIAAGQFACQGAPVAAGRTVKEGECFVQSLPGTIEPAINPNIRLLHEDDWILVVDKPAPLPMHPSGRYNRNTLLMLLSNFFPKQKLRAAHRLDAETSGVVVLCRTYQAARTLQPQFTQGQIEKTYWARIHGHPSWESIDCGAAIGAEPLAQGKREIAACDGLEARTEFKVLRRDPDGTAIVEAVPLTGRTHQIRLHLQHLGYPIVGDKLYGEVAALIGRARANEPPEPALCLHAAQITLTHPHYGHRQTFAAPAPAWMGQNG
jgi:UPF0176 protein